MLRLQHSPEFVLVGKTKSLRLTFCLTYILGDNILVNLFSHVLYIILLNRHFVDSIGF
jgi:hypothetical protein